MNRVALVTAILLIFIAPMAGSEHAAMALAVPETDTFGQCQGCYAFVIAEDVFDPNTTYKAQWDHFENDDGRCPPSAEDCVHCDGDPGCEADGGALGGFETEYSAWVWIGDQTPCGTMLCGGLAQEQIAVLRESPDRWSANDLARAIASSAGTMWVNHERSAIQALGCGAGVRFHVPVTGDFVATVNAQLQALLEPQ